MHVVVVVGGDDRKKNKVTKKAHANDSTGFLAMTDDMDDEDDKDNEALLTL